MMVVKNVLHSAAIVLTSALCAQDFVQEIHSTQKTCALYVQKFAKPVRKNVGSMLLIMKVVKPVQKLVKSVQKLAHNKHLGEVFNLPFSFIRKTMRWSDKQIWRQSFISTFICLIGCSIGVMGAAYYLVGLNLLPLLLISLVAGFITCMIVMTVWEVSVHKMNLKEAIKHSYKMSLISIMIMMLTENVILLLVIPKLSSHQMQMGIGATHDFAMMAIAMSLGFVFSLPYNYYQLQKTGKICQEPMKH